MTRKRSRFYTSIVLRKWLSLVTDSEVQAISQELANTDGILTQVISVTDMEGLSEMLTPDYLHRFVTERVRTINTTAIGGNASLLELGTE